MVDVLTGRMPFVPEVDLSQPAMSKTPRQSKEETIPAKDNGLPMDVITALGTLQEFIANAAAMPPQVIVTCRDETRAFGRSALQAMSYRRATDMFISRFSTRDDWWISEYRYKPEVWVYARFYRQHGDGDEDFVLLDERGWSELVGNAVRLSVVFRSMKVAAKARALGL